MLKYVTFDLVLALPFCNGMVDFLSALFQVIACLADLSWKSTIIKMQIIVEGMCFGKRAFQKMVYQLFIFLCQMLKSFLSQHIVEKYSSADSVCLYLSCEKVRFIL